MFVWSQSSLKDLENEATCPSRWKFEWLDKGGRKPPNLPQMYGLHFERLVLGASAHDETLNLPALKTGKPPVAQIRLEEQASEVKAELFKPDNMYGFTPTSVQQRLNGEIFGVPVSGVLDAIDDSHEEPVILDLKSTGDADNDYSEYGWGNDPKDMDLLQQILYEELYFQNSGVKPKSKLLIADYSPRKKIKLLNLTITEEAKELNLERFKFGSEVVEHYNTNGWSYKPSESECATCQVQDCPFRINESPINIIDVII